VTALIWIVIGFMIDSKILETPVLLVVITDLDAKERSRIVINQLECASTTFIGT
jgi:hypothetical protein